MEAPVSDRDWYRIDDVKPPEGKEVRVMSHAGQVARLTRRGNKYWFPDMSYSVQWTPAYWQHVEVASDDSDCSIGKVAEAD